MKQESRLQFEEKKVPSKLRHDVAAAPAEAAIIHLHRRVRECEDDNVGVESAHKLEESAETGGRLIQKSLHSRNMKHQRANGESAAPLKTNPLSKWQQKKAIKRESAMARSGNATVGWPTRGTEYTVKAARKATDKAKRIGQFIMRHKKGAAVIASVFLVLIILLNGLSSFFVMMEGVTTGMLGSTYPSADGDMLAAEDFYLYLEEDLRDYLNTYENTHDHDEYYYDLDAIDHDPYELISLLTALCEGRWTMDEVEDTLRMIFERQYDISEHVDVEIRYRTEVRFEYEVVEDPVTGEIFIEETRIEEQIPYYYYICTVTVENVGLTDAGYYLMSAKQREIYNLYMETLGNRPDLFPYSDYLR